MLYYIYKYVFIYREREPFFEDAKKVILSCTEGDTKGSIAAHSISNMFFILRKDYTAKKIEQIAGISETKNKDIYVLKGSKNPGFEKEYDTDDPDVVVTFSDDAMSGDTFLYDKEGEFHLYITYEAPKDKIDKYLDKEAGIKNQDRTSGKIISESISRPLHVVTEKKAKELVKQGITVLTDDGQIYQIK